MTSKQYVGKPCVKCGERDRYTCNRKCVKCHRVWQRSYRRRHPEKKRRRDRGNSKKERESKYRAYWANPEKARAKKRAWRKRNPGKNKANRHRRRARKLNAVSIQYSFKEICTYYGNKCLRCGRTDKFLSRDHIIPLSRGGSDIPTNIQPLCISCNCKKGIKMTDYRPRAYQPYWKQPSLF